jgi:hypothetical protein
MRQLVERHALIASWRAFLLKTGSTPGIPKHTGQVFSFAGLPNSVEHEQNIFDWVFNWAWTSSPITIS